MKVLTWSQKQHGRSVAVCPAGVFHSSLRKAEDADGTVSESVVGAVVLLVLPQVHLLLEAVEAAGAAVGPVVPVFAAVGDEVGALAECLPTDHTHVGLLSWNIDSA